MAVTDTDYSATYALTDVFDSSVAQDSGGVTQNGVPQGNLVTAMSNYVTNYNAMDAKLDLDGGVTGENYAELCNLSAIGSAGYKITNNGLRQDLLYTFLAAIETQFEVLTAKLDADGGVTGENYGTLWNFDLDTTKINANGIMDQGDVVDYMNTVYAALNGVLTKLDAD